MSVFFKYVGPVKDVNGMTVRYRESGGRTVQVGPIYHNDTQFEVVNDASIRYFDAHPHYERSTGENNATDEAKAKKIILYVPSATGEEETPIIIGS
jgi:hypothetical protein